MIEIFFILALLFGVFILFYRQAIDQYNILQIEGTQLSDLPKLLSERTPVVVRGVGAPKLFTPETLNGNPRLLTFPVTSQMTLGSYLQNPYNEKPYTMTKPVVTQLARETGLQVWAEHAWFSKFFSNTWFEMFFGLQSEAHLGEKGLRKTTAIYTMIYPTSSALDVTILTEQQQQYLPKAWRGKFPEKITIQDTPLAGEIKYISIKLRPGTVLILPTHWFISIRAADDDKKKPVLWSWMEVHNPVSYLASKMESNVEG